MNKDVDVKRYIEVLASVDPLPVAETFDINKLHHQHKMNDALKANGTTWCEAWCRITYEMYRGG